MDRANTIENKHTELLFVRIARIYVQRKKTISLTNSPFSVRRNAFHKLPILI